MNRPLDLKKIYLRTLDACAPEELVRRVRGSDLPRSVVAVGKCAGGLLDGIGDFDDAFAAIPEGYPEPRNKAGVTIARGGHPGMSASSFAAGRALVEFVDRHSDVLFLISGGGSACVEVPLEPWFDEDDLMDMNARLVASNTPIGEINCVRKHLSAIKGGRLGARVRGRAVTLVYSDVSSGALAAVASGPTLPDMTTKLDAVAIVERVGGSAKISNALRHSRCPETIRDLPRAVGSLIADNGTLTAAAAAIAGPCAVQFGKQIECGVEEAATLLLERAKLLRGGELLVAGGEPTVTVRGEGKGGRCSELAVRVAIDAAIPLTALFASSDGRDGNSDSAGVLLPLPARLDKAEAERELARSNSLAVAASVGEVLTMPPTGNNLRDLYLLARS